MSETHQEHPCCYGDPVVYQREGSYCLPWSTEGIPGTEQDAGLLTLRLYFSFLFFLLSGVTFPEVTGWGSGGSDPEDFECASPLEDLFKQGWLGPSL